MHFRFPARFFCPHQCRAIFTCLRQRLSNRRGISLVGFLQGYRQNCAALQIHRMLRFVRQMRPTIFHLGKSARLHHADGPNLCCWLCSFACDPSAPDLRASACRFPIPSPILSEIPRNSLHCLAARWNASPRWPPAWSRRSPRSYPSAALDLSAIPKSRRTPCAASPHRSAVASARSSNDPASLRPTPCSETSAAPWNRLLAKRSPVPNQCPQNIPPAAIGHRFLGLLMVAHCSRRKISRTPSRRTRRILCLPTVHSPACRKDAPAHSPAHCGQSTTALAAASAFVFPSPSALLLEFDGILREKQTETSYFRLHTKCPTFTTGC